MSSVMESGMEDVSGSRFGVPDGRPEGGREVRWSARRKEEVVLRLLRGETLDALARESGQAAGTISSWREEFLQGGHEGLKSRPAPIEERRLALTSTDARPPARVADSAGAHPRLADQGCGCARRSSASAPSGCSASMSERRACA
jgi:hypothetical protein